METKTFLVELFTIPQAASGSGKANWIGCRNGEEPTRNKVWKVD